MKQKMAEPRAESEGSLENAKVDDDEDEDEDEDENLDLQKCATEFSHYCQVDVSKEV